MTPFAASGSSHLATNLFNMPTPETPYGRLLNVQTLTIFSLVLFYY